MFHTYFFPNLSVHCVKCEGRIDNRLKKLKQDGGINIEGQWVPLVETIEGFCVDLDEKELTVVASGDIRKLNDLAHSRTDSNSTGHLPRVGRCAVLYNTAPSHCNKC